MIGDPPSALARELLDDGLNPLREAAKRQLLDLVSRETEIAFRRFVAFLGYVSTSGLNPSAVWTHGEIGAAPKEPEWFAVMYANAKTSRARSPGGLDQGAAQAGGTGFDSPALGR